MTVVKVEKLSKKIKDKEILRNISFEINDGECVALIGPNGAGKTTLLDCLLGDKLVTSGQVSIQGLPALKRRRREITKMKRWIALSKIEFLLTKRQLIYYLLSVGMPTAFYLFFSGIYQDTPGEPANFMRDYLISMTAFSMMSTTILSFPAVLHTDKMNNWQKTLRHSPVNMVEYYLSKITSMLVDYLVSILVVFTVGHFVRGVDMPLVKWVGAAILLIVGSIAFVALGLTLTLLPTSQLMSVVGNLLYLGLAVLGGLWMPISLFPDWMQAVGKCLPTYQLMELLKTFLNEGGINLSATVYLLVFSAVLFGLTIYLQGHKENA